MDIHYFLCSRIIFIRQFYELASAPFVERKRKIKAQEEPFVPPYSEDGEPPFLDEWMEADESLHILAYSCISMLASALHLFLEAWIGRSGVAVDESLKKKFKNNGWLSGYDAHFANCFGIAFNNGPADLRILEEIILARNRIEHPNSITEQKAQYSELDMRKISHPLFVDKTEIALLNLSEDSEPRWFMPSTINVSESQLLAAVTEVEKFAGWFDTEINRVVYER
jgi:hypothetical protein